MVAGWLASLPSWLSPSLAAQPGIAELTMAPTLVCSHLKTQGTSDKLSTYRMGEISLATSSMPSRLCFDTYEKLAMTGVLDRLFSP